MAEPAFTDRLAKMLKSLLRCRARIYDASWPYNEQCRCGSPEVDDFLIDRGLVLDGSHQVFCNGVKRSVDADVIIKRV